MKTYATKAGDITRSWYVIDAADVTLGRLATEVAEVLMGKRKPIFTRHLDTGDFVVVVNADKVRVTGNKLTKKFYYRHSGYPGGFKQVALSDMLESKPDFVIKHAVQGMLPRNRLGEVMIHKLKIYAGPEHPHQAQQPVELQLVGKE